MLAPPDNKTATEASPCCRHLHGAFRRREGLVGRYARDNVVLPLFCSRHDHLVGLHPAPSWVRGGSEIGCLLTKIDSELRERSSIRRVTSFQTHRPPYIIEGPEPTKGRLSQNYLEQPLEESDAAIRPYLSVEYRDWCRFPGLSATPPLNLDRLFVFPERTVEQLRHAAFVRMADWRLPGLAHADDTPIVAALRTALWVRKTIACPSAEFYRGFHPEGQILRRLLPLSRPIRRDDIDAARLVIDHALRVVLCDAAAERRRWRAVVPGSGAFLTDWLIIKAILGEGRSARDVAKLFDLGHSIVAKRFDTAVATIADSLGSLSGQNRKFGTGVRGSIERRTDKPVLLVEPKPELPAFPPRPSLFARCDELLTLIAKAEAAGKVRRVADGCARGYPEEPHRDRADLVRWNPDTDDDDTGISRPEPGLWTEGRHVVTAQRAVNWYSIAQNLPAGPRSVALVSEQTIGQALNDTSLHERDCNPYHPTSKLERRFAASFLNKGEADKSKQHNSTDGYCGPVEWRDGKLVARPYEDGRVANDAVDRLAAVTNRSDDFGTDLAVP
jgi:hypothetical protein